MGDSPNVTRIRRDELIDVPGPPEIRRRQAIAEPGLWAGISTTDPGIASGWHHHGHNDTVVYMLAGHLILEFGANGEGSAEAEAGDFVVIRAGVVHRELTPEGGGTEAVVIRVGDLDGPPTVEVDGPGG